MRCPDCGHLSSKVVDSRPAPEGDVIRRRRECEQCGERFTTHERSERSLPLVIKQDGRREPWSREKLLKSLGTACRKRPVTALKIDRMVERVEAKMAQRGERELPSADIGEALLFALKKVDEVAYARFASVYLRFESLDDFQRLAETEDDA